MAEFPFHTIYSLHHYNNFLPWSVCSWLSFSNVFSKNFLQMVWCCRNKAKNSKVIYIYISKNSEPNAFFNENWVSHRLTVMLENTNCSSWSSCTIDNGVMIQRVTNNQATLSASQKYVMHKSITKGIRERKKKL